MQPAEIPEQRAAHHDVVEVRDDKVRVADVNVYGERSQKQPGHAAESEQTDEAERIEHRRVVRDRSFVKRRRPVEDFNGRGNCDRETQKRKDHSRINRLAGDKQMMAPNQETENGDGQAREGHKLITEDIFAREVRNQLADYTHRRQHHDVNRRMRVKPEEMLEQDWIASGRRIENAYMCEAFERHQQD